jgi:hypothetical protein
MYGMVNRALEEMISERYGQQSWDAIRRLAGVEEDFFFVRTAYPDSITYDLVGAASKHLKVSVPEILEAFGSHWVLQTAMRGYGELLASGGSDLRRFLLNLPNFHSRVGLIFPDLRPPTFRCSDVADDSLCLHYYSQRPGLAHMVIGLLHGLGVMFHTQVEVTHTRATDDSGGHDAFLVRWWQAQG